jgi:cation diffusion facilitator family transporter
LLENPSAEGIRAVKWSLAILAATAGIQVVIVLLSGSVALLADTVHNVGDALTAVPLWVAFSLSRRAPTKTFTYGLGRVEDLAGIAVVLVILFSAVYAAYESVARLVDPQPVSHLTAVAIAAAVGFAGNEAVAILRIKVGRRIGSAALVADGYHARTDGLTSLAVLLGALGVWLGFGLADPIIGLLISAAIFRIVWQSARSVLTRAADGVEPGVADEVRHAAEHAPGVRAVTDTRVRWVGHRMRAEVAVAVDPGLSVAEGHDVAVEVRHQLLHHLRHLDDATVHVDPETASGHQHHAVELHQHGGLPLHSH